MVTPGDLLQPEGPLEEAVFESTGDVWGYLEGWVSRAPSDASDPATKAFACWKAYEWKAEQATDTPAQEDYDDAGSMRYTDSQRATWAEKAKNWEARFRARYDGEDPAFASTDSEKPRQRGPRSRSVSTSTAWT